MNDKNNLRIIPLVNKEGESILKNKSIDYQIYELLQVHSYLNKDKIRFCYKADTTQSGLYREYCSFCEQNQQKPVSRTTFIRHFKNLFYVQMVQENEIKDLNGNLIKAYVLPQDYKIFQLVPLDTMRFLTHVASNSVIRIYGYLLNKFQIKNNYRFTLKELVTEALGLSYNVSGIESTAKDCLLCLVKLGLVKYVEVYDVTNSHAVPKKMLVNVNTTINKPRIKVVKG